MPMWQAGEWRTTPDCRDTGWSPPSLPPSSLSSPANAPSSHLKGSKGKDVPLCLLVTTRNIRGGILVDCQGYDYARYAAEVLDKSALDLRDVPVDHYDLKLRQPRSQRER